MTERANTAAAGEKEEEEEGGAETARTKREESNPLVFSMCHESFAPTLLEIQQERGQWQQLASSRRRQRYSWVMKGALRAEAWGRRGAGGGAAAEVAAGAKTSRP